MRLKREGQSIQQGSEREEDVMEMLNLKCIQKPHKINERKHISPHVSSEIVYNEEREYFFR